MREIITYVAFDDKEFSSKSDCLKYEKKALDCVREFISKIAFMNEKKERISVIGDSIEETLDNINFAYQTCEYISMGEFLSKETYKFIWNQIGIFLPKKIGLFKYDDYDDWVQERDD